MFVSIFDIFKIGIGPSSSHTLGPMKAGNAFIKQLTEENLINKVTRVQANVYGSLSLTGIGHSTDKAIILGLAGERPETVNVDSIDEFVSAVYTSEKLLINGSQEVDFPREGGINFYNETLPMHENGLCLIAYQDDMEILHKTYYSVGGGFIVDQENFAKQNNNYIKVPYEFNSAEQLLNLCKKDKISLAELAWKNELSVRKEQEIINYIQQVWDVMHSGMTRGMQAEGMLPGNLFLSRRAKSLYQRLQDKNSNSMLDTMSWINLFAISVSEENASCGRVVTAPTNGACGVVPAVLHYYDKFVAPVNDKILSDFILVSTQIAALYKMNASISGAEVGCQGEIGVACSIAAAGLAQLMGATPEQVCIAAEIGMEHHLGLTCDPVLGQVQVPCIERNGIAAVTAVNAVNMALQRDSSPSVSLDEVITTMYKTGKDMSQKYRETSLGGLAVTVKASHKPCS